MSRASEDLMDQLHALSAQALIDEINAYRNGERFHPPKYDKEGNQLPPEPMSLPAAIVAQAIKLLKDNGIDRPGRPGDVIDKLADALPSDDDVSNLVKFPGDSQAN